MKKGVLLLLICLFCKIGSVYAQGTECNLDTGKKAFIMSRFCTEVKCNFVHYPDLKFDWDSLCMANFATLTATKSDDEFMDGLEQLCAKLSDGHTKVYSINNQADAQNWIRPFPMITKRVGDQVFVIDVYSSEFKKQRLGYGSELLEIDGQNIIEYANNHIRPTFASSTPQWSNYAIFSGFELTKAKGTKMSQIKFRTPDGKISTIKSDRNIRWDIKSTSSAMDFRVLSDSIGLLTISSFDDGSFSRDQFDQIYQDIQKTKALIIDIRDNGGGNSSHADYIISHFADRPFRGGRWSSLMYIAAHASWGYSQEIYMMDSGTMDPIQDKPTYLEPIALLVNATTFSSAENFCVTFKGLRRGKIIGTPTGGKHR